MKKEKSNFKNRTKRIVTISGAIFLFTAIGLTANAFYNPKKNSTRQEAIVYKTPTCGCCAVYVKYLKKQGFNVTVKDLLDLSPIKQRYGIPADKDSCHTTIINDYAIEGHVPIEAINKLLNEKPDVKGIALPDMPIGSPGMPGKKLEKFTIYNIGVGVNNNDDSVFMTI